MENKTYIQILIDSQDQKVKILERLLGLTKEQSELLEDLSFEPDDFTNIIQKKEEYINKLEVLDKGFQHLFKKVKGKITENKYKYKEEIEELKETITLIAGLSTELELKEKVNKRKIETFFSLKKKEIKDFKKSKSTVDNYQNNMNGQDNNSSFFFDSKK